MEPIHYALLAGIAVLYVVKKVTGFRRNKLILEYLQEGAVIIDVRSSSEYSQGHYPRARNIPLESVEQQLSNHKNKEENFIVYCASGARSRSAKAKMTQLGFTNVVNGGGFYSMPTL